MNTQTESTTAEARWAAVAARERTDTRAFRYGVRTTGIYCRPGCPSRLPRRENVEFFDDWQAAERAGYRPCRRCHPRNPSAAPHAAAVAAACRRLEREDPAPGLADLAADAGLSRWHFQRVFRRIVGVSPKQYASAVRAGRLREALAAAHPVTEALLDAGYGSLGHAYEDSASRLGMTPTTFRAGGRGEHIRTACATCALGWVGIGVTDRGIAAIELADSRADADARLRARFPRARIEADGGALADLVQAVARRVERPGDDAELPLDIRGTAFQQRVWAELQAIPPGRTASYRAIARRLGVPRAARAVGRAVAANPLAVAVPCHRAVRSDGGLGGYRWGEARKRTLLARESEVTPHEDNDTGTD